MVWSIETKHHGSLKRLLVEKFGESQYTWVSWKPSGTSQFRPYLDWAAEGRWYVGYSAYLNRKPSFSEIDKAVSEVPTATRRAASLAVDYMSS